MTKSDQEKGGVNSWDGGGLGEGESNEEEEPKAVSTPLEKGGPRQLKSPPSASLTKANARKGTDLEDDDEIDEISLLPSEARLTEAGGYLSTKAQRRKISAANKGKQPWNKGKNRSEEVKARISAGVKARNRRRLLASLEQLGLTEDEYTSTKKRLKCARENLRNIKLLSPGKEASAPDQHQENEAVSREQRADSVAAATVALESRHVAEVTADMTVDIEAGKVAEKVAETTVEATTATDSTMPVLAHMTVDGLFQRYQQLRGEDPDDFIVQKYHQVCKEEAEEESDESLVADDDSYDDYHVEMVPEIFRQDFVWSPHATFGNGERPIEGTCPDGGPGGLLCCTACTTAYLDYLVSTHTALEEQKLAKVSAEVQTITGFLTTNRARLKESVRAAQSKPPPAKLEET